MAAAGNPNGETNESLTIAVVSDVHAYDGVLGDDAPSHCCVSENSPRKNSLSGLREFIVAQSLKADLLFCPGDLGEKAQPVAIQYAWRELQQIKNLLSAKQLFVTTGNHDVDSRHSYNSYDAKGMLQTLDPSYPFDNGNLSDRYWSRHFVVISESQYRILILNSSAFHGEGRFSDTHKHEYEHGRISEHTLNMIRKELEGTSTPPVNILLCHHHPHTHAEINLGDADVMQGGDALLQLIGSGDYGQWLVVHGHKHHPKIVNAAGGLRAPIVFAAGSVGAVLYRELQTNSRNQFYLINLPYSVFPQFGFVGTFQSWDWFSEQGWQPASKNAQLPPLGGFGLRTDPDVVAGQIASAIGEVDVRWSQLIVTMPQLQYVMPQDLRLLMRLLRQTHNLIVEPESDIPPTLIGRNP